MFFDPLYFIIMLPFMALAFWAQMRVKGSFAQASKVPAAGRLTGAETARVILDAHNLTNVGIERVAGRLSDHYDPRHKVLRLSADVYDGRSVASAGIAAHEAGHAIQDATNYAPLVLRNGIVPMASIGSNLSFIFIIAGIFIGMASTWGAGLLWLGVGLFSVVVLFQVINLPVEFDASNRAKRLLGDAGLVSAGGEAKVMNKMLNAAALTYIAATLTAVATLIYYVILATSSRE